MVSENNLYAFTVLRRRHFTMAVSPKLQHESGELQICTPNWDGSNIAFCRRFHRKSNMAAAVILKNLYHVITMSCVGRYQLNLSGHVIVHADDDMIKIETVSIEFTYGGRSFLANVKSRSRSIMSSPVCLPVCNVRAPCSGD